MLLNGQFRTQIHSSFSVRQVEWVLNGTWDSKMEGSKVIGEAVVKGKSSLGMTSLTLLMS